MADEPTPSSPTSETPPPRTTGGNFRWEPPTAEELQKLMPGYTIEKILGRGGMGAVYRGVQTNLDRPVAIKILPPGVEKEDPSFAERFKSEARLMARLSHPAVVAVYDFGTNLGGQLYFAMEYVDGSDVSQMIAAQGKLPPEHALAITAHVCDALQAAHELGIVHRDIKPANVLLNMKGQVKVADFGLAKVEDPGQHGLTKTGYAMGTPDFVAPEALMLGTAIDGRADLYAVGVMLYQMLTGNIPRGAFKPASVLVPGLDPRFDPIILKAMQHDREERHQNAAELRRELDVILTVPFVRNDAPVSAAIPVAQVAQAPGQRSAAQKPQPRSAGAPTRQPSIKAGEGTRAPETPPKSKTPLFIGIAAAAAIGIGAFVMFGSKKEAKQSGPLSPLSGTPSVADASKPAQGTVRTTLSPPEPAKPQPKPAPPPVSTSPSLPVSKSSEPQFPPGKWVKVFTKLEDLPDDLRSRQTAGMKDGWIKAADSAKQLHLPPQLTGNYAVRAHFRHRANNKLASYLNLRVHGPERERYQLFLSDGGFLSLQSQRGGKFSILTSQQSQRELKPGETFQLSLGIVGSRLVTRLGAELVSSHVDVAHVSGPGFLHLQDDVRDIEVINLDGLSEAEALKILGVDEKGNDLRGAAAVASSSPAPPITNPQSSISNASAAAFPPGQWVKVFDNLEEMSKAGVTAKDKEISHVDGWFVPSFNAIDLRINKLKGTNLGIRGKFKVTRERVSFDVLSEASCHRFTTFLGAGSLDLSIPQESKQLYNSQAALAPQQSEFTMEYACVDGRYIGRLNGKIEFLVPDRKRSGAALSIYNSGAFRDIEVINLDGLPEAEALRILGVDEKGNDLRALAAKQEQQKAAMAKAADALAAIPELKALHEQFVKLQAERVTAPFEAEVAKLNAGYVGGIDREIANEKKAGHLDGVIALEAEKKLIQGAGVSNSPSSDGTWKVPLPEDDEQTPANLKALRQIYRDTYAKLEAAHTANLKALTDPLSVRLKQLESTLTQQNRVPDAKAVRAYADSLERSPASGPAPAVAGEASSTASKPANAPAKIGKVVKPQDAFSEREAAEWALSFAGAGGTYVTIWQPNKGEQRIQSLAVLPKEKFTVRELQVTPVPGPDQDRVTDQDILRLLGLQEVNTIRLTSTKLTALALRALAQISTLEALTFPSEGLEAADLAALEGAPVWQLNLPRLRVTDANALKVLTTLKNLRFLTLGELMDAEMLAALPVLPKLEVLVSTINLEITDEALPLMAPKFPSLQRLDLWGSTTGSTKITGSTLGSLSGLKDLFDLGLNFTQVDDASLKPLAEFRSLKRIGLAKTKVTDACVPTLKAMRGLNYLDIHQGQITDAGLLELAEIRSLQTLKVFHTGCPPIGPPATGFTEAGVTAFAKKRPDVKVER